MANKILVIVATVFWSLTIQAKQFVTPLDKVQWIESGDRFSCSLSTNVKNYGRVSFYRKAGYELALQLESVTYPQAITQLQLGWSQAPWSLSQLPPAQWLHQGETFSKSSVFLAQVPQLLQSLGNGQWGRLKLSLADQSEIELVLPTVDLANKVNAYHACVSKISPLSFEQVRDLNFYFESGTYLVNEDQIRKLQDIARYVQLDTRVTKVLVDGYTDNAGNIAANLGLARKRADDLASVLIEAGVTAKLLEVRAHGDRYPVATNKTKKGRQQNRRVNLRIVRSTDT